MRRIIFVALSLFATAALAQPCAECPKPKHLDCSDLERLWHSKNCGPHPIEGVVPCESSPCTVQPCAPTPCCAVPCQPTERVVTMLVPPPKPVGAWFGQGLAGYLDGPTLGAGVGYKFPHGVTLGGMALYQYKHAAFSTYNCSNSLSLMGGSHHGGNCGYVGSSSHDGAYGFAATVTFPL